MKKIYWCLAFVFAVSLIACGKNEPDSTKEKKAAVEAPGGQTAPTGKEGIESLYTNCVSTPKNQKACEELINTIKGGMPPDKAKINLAKLCIKYGIQQACEP